MLIELAYVLERLKTYIGCIVCKQYFFARGDLFHKRYWTGFDYAMQNGIVSLATYIYHGKIR